MYKQLDYNVWRSFLNWKTYQLASWFLCCHFLPFIRLICSNYAYCFVVFSLKVVYVIHLLQCIILKLFLFSVLFKMWYLLKWIIFYVHNNKSCYLNVLWSGAGCGRLPEDPAEDEQILGDEGVHNQDEDQRDHQSDNRIHQIHDMHEFIIVWQ